MKKTISSGKQANALYSWGLLSAENWRSFEAATSTAWQVTWLSSTRQLTYARFVCTVCTHRIRWSCKGLTSTPQQILWIHLNHLLRMTMYNLSLPKLSANYYGLPTTGLLMSWCSLVGVSLPTDLWYCTVPGFWDRSPTSEHMRRKAERNWSFSARKHPTGILGTLAEYLTRLSK